MFGVLSSIVFWMLWFGGSFFIGTIVLKYFSPRTFKHIITGKDRWGDNDTEDMIAVGIIVIVVYLFWPVFLFGWILKLLFVKVLWSIFRAGIKGVDEMVPEIKIKKKEE
jgi:Na+/proline symporter